jgi:hypothetical protein
MAEIASTTFSQTDGSNTGPLPGLSGATDPNQIDNSIQAMMGAIKREHDWRNLFITSGGSANAYTLTYSVAPAAYYTGQVFSFTANFGCTGSATLNVNGLGAKTIKKDVAGTMTALSSSDIASGAKVIVSYDGADFIWTNWQGTAGTSYTVNGQTEETAPAVGDFLGGYDISGTAERKFTIGNVFKTITGLTAETAVAVDDELPLYDTSAGTADKATVQNVLKAINGLTEDTSPDTSADFVLTYDTSATDVKKVKPSKLGGGVTLLGTITTTSGASQSLSSLTLTSYKFLKLVFRAVSANATAFVLVGNSTADDVQITPSISSLTDIISGFCEIELSTGRATFIGITGASDAVSGTMSNRYAPTAITTASTAVSLAVNTGAFDAGAVDVYGLR